MMNKHLLALFLCFSFAFSIEANDVPSLQIVHQIPEVSFRAIVVRDSGTIVVAGTRSTVVRSADGGQTWKKVSVLDSDELDFRDVEAVGENNLVLMSAGSGELSRVFRSTDNGERWSECHRNKHPKGFYDGISFWPNGTGLLIGDPIDGRLTVLKSNDSGLTWQPNPAPEVAEGEYGFAASGTGIVCTKGGRCLIATGGKKARVFSSADFGQTWQTTDTTVRQGNESSGLFSIAEHPNGQAVAVGGNYLDPDKATNNYAFRSSVDALWETGRSKLPHKACVRFLDAERVLCAGRTGIALSRDAGKTWQSISGESFFTMDVDTSTDTVFLAGANGRIACLNFKNE